MSTNNILTLDDINFTKCLNNLLDSKEGDEKIAATKTSYTIKDKGMLANLKDYKKGTAVTIQWLEIICDFFEKLRNLVYWEDPNMTFLLLVLLIVLFLFVTFLPLRVIFTFAIFYKFCCGLKW